MTPSNNPSPKPIKAWAVIDRDTNNEIIELCRHKHIAEAISERPSLYHWAKGSSIIELEEIRPVSSSQEQDRPECIGLKDTLKVQESVASPTPSQTGKDNTLVNAIADYPCVSNYMVGKENFIEKLTKENEELKVENDKFKILNENGSYAWNKLDKDHYELQLKAHLLEQQVEKMREALKHCNDFLMWMYKGWDYPLGSWDETRGLIQKALSQPSQEGQKPLPDWPEAQDATVKDPNCTCGGLTRCLVHFPLEKSTKMMMSEPIVSREASAEEALEWLAETEHLELIKCKDGTYRLLDHYCEPDTVWTTGKTPLLAIQSAMRVQPQQKEKDGE
jgi:hypothetical protein